MWIRCRMWSVDAIKAVKSFRSLAYQSSVKLAPRRNDSNVPPYCSHHELEELFIPWFQFRDRISRFFFTVLNANILKTLICVLIG